MNYILENIKRNEIISLQSWGMAESEESITEKNFVSGAIHSLFGNSRGIALGALKEGLTLSGYNKFPLITRVFPAQAINKLFFAPTRVEANYILQIPRPEYSREDTLGKEWMKNQERFIEEVFKQMIEDRRDDQDFLSDLLHFITGLVMCQIPTPDLTTVFLLSLMIIWCSY